MSRDRDEPTTIAAILDMEPSASREDKSWIGGTFEAVIRRAEKIEPRGARYHFFVCQMHDPTDDRKRIKATSDVDFVQMEGQLVEVSGSGISREEWKKGVDYPRGGEGTPEIKMGKNAKVQVIGSGGAATPSGRSDDRKAPAATPDKASKGERVPYGPAVGGAIQNAITAIIAEAHPVPGSPEFAALLYNVASDILRINEYMEKGHLADSAKDRANPEAAAERALAANAAKLKAKEEAKAKAEAEEAARKLAEQEANQTGAEDDDDDDVPF